MSKPIARLTRPETFLKQETSTNWMQWRHLAWIFPVASLILVFAIGTYIWILTKFIKLATSWGWLS